MATLEKTLSLEDVDVFSIPHHRMKQLLQRAYHKTQTTDYENPRSFDVLLKELASTFLELKQHEEIENKYIMRILKQELEGDALRKLLIHLHAHSHISDILKELHYVKEQFKNGLFSDLKILGSNLNNTIEEFFQEYVPHMKEEEQVLQPMLMELLTFDELHGIQEIVFQLHHLKHFKEEQLVIERSLLTEVEKVKINDTIDSITLKKKDTKQGSISQLPNEIWLHVFSFLGPQELCTCAQVSQKWNKLAYTGNLWRTLHLSRWGRGDWRFGEGLSSDDCNCDCEPNYELLTFDCDDNVTEDANDRSEELDDKLEGQMKRENKILHGVARYVLRKVRYSVKAIVLECSKAITNGMLFRILSQCSNLEYLDVSQTIISDLGLKGLFKNSCSNLKYLDVSGCENLSDQTLSKLSTSLGKVSNLPCESCNCTRKEDEYKIDVRKLEVLRLSGCHKITDVGLRALSKYGGLPLLRHLDLSGCVNVTNNGIEGLVSKCPAIVMSQLFYCDNIFTDSYDHVAGGCQNNGCRNRVCCRTGLE